LQTILAVVQIIDQAVTRMRQSTHVRTLLEVALVQITSLDELDDLAVVIGQLQSGRIPTSAPTAARTGQPAKRPATPAAVQLRKVHDPAQKKTKKLVEPIANDRPQSPHISKLDASSAESVWKQTLSKIEDMTADYGSFYDHVAISAPNHLVVYFKARYTLQKESLERPERRATVEQALALVTGKPVHVQFEVVPDEESVQDRSKPVASMRQLRRDIETNSMVHAAIELFDAEIDRVDRPRPTEPDRR